MKYKELANKLGFTGSGQVERMFKSLNFSSVRMTKVLTEEKKEKKVKLLLLQKYGVFNLDALELVDFLENNKELLK